MSQLEMNELEETLDALWEMHDEASAAGDLTKAAELSVMALRVVDKLPKNSIYLSTKH